MAKNITVVGSTNIDKVVTVPRFANSGETLHTSNAQQEVMGGKGLNQAVAAERSGASVTFITKVGQEFDTTIITNSQEQGISAAGILSSTTAETGQAYITVSGETGDNIIYIYGGANSELTAQDVTSKQEYIAQSDFVVAQLEVPVKAVTTAFDIAKEQHHLTVLNPAPMPEDGFPTELLERTDIIVPNQHETFLLTGIEAKDAASLKANAEFYFQHGVKLVIITLGENGAFYMHSTGESGSVPAFKTNAVDTTAAGDTFIGSLVSELDTDMSNLEDAMTYAAAAAAITVSREGAQPSVPRRGEVETMIKENHA
ncbi:MAG: ribokinase [Micrococcaceae bacterium]